ncbi:MAG TPA: R3H domain-containing nucleic acid-binding protein [Patescibacteria group bacterium]|nr:R3H domain-containing nucleic acid-binding protein [Patescibacteria group bacterium]
METQKEIQNLLSELFKLIGIEVKAEITEEKQEEGTLYKIELDPGESTGLLIGAHGMTLSSIQSFLTIAMKQKTGDWVKISLDVAHWSEKQNERLVELAKQTAERARQTGEEKLYNLNANSRRIIHMTLAEEKDIETVSEGEGIDRYLVVRHNTKLKK